MPSKSHVKAESLIVLLPLRGFIGLGAPKALFLTPSREMPVANPHRVLTISTTDGRLLDYILCAKRRTWLIYREVALAS